MNWTYPLLAICTTIIFIIVWAFQTGGRKSMVCKSLPQDLGLEEKTQDMHSLIFDDLSPAEMIQVNRYLQQNLAVLLVDPSEAKPSDNCIYSITLQLPPKAEVLEFLDHQGRRPAREALVVVYFGNQNDPNITEFLVGPLPNPTYHRDITVEKYAPNFMHKVFDYNRNNLMYFHAMPPGFESGDRLIWIFHFQNVSGFPLHPVGFEVLLDVSSLNISDWRVKKVFYNGQYFEDMEDIERQFNEGYVKVAKVEKSPPDGGYSSLKQRVPPKGPGPLHYEPRGPRYSITNNQVNFMSWSFSFGTDVLYGPRVFDIRFQGERIVYELSLQDALAVYGSNSPGLMRNRYMDLSYGLGSNIHTLTPGVDCPYLATYLDRHYFVDTSSPVTREASICIFEQNAEVPIRRHYNMAQSPFYGGLVDSAVVFRSITSYVNYDYIWDFIFHQNGAVSVRSYASGYIQSSFFFGNASEFGNRVQEWVLGTIHTHSFQFKVDMDVGGKLLSITAVFPKCSIFISLLVAPDTVHWQNYFSLFLHSEHSMKFMASPYYGIIY
uniref:Amine oxidase n=1 Tax=Anolis carolinensis TaxID=28377 RepID=A0A803T2U5_ANOCA